MTKIIDYIKAMESGIEKGRSKAIDKNSKKEIDQVLKLVNDKRRDKL